MDSPNSMKSWDLISEHDFPVKSIEKSGHPELTEQYSEKWNEFVEKRNQMKEEYFNQWKEDVNVEDIFLEFPQEIDDNTTQNTFCEQNNEDIIITENDISIEQEQKEEKKEEQKEDQEEENDNEIRNNGDIVINIKDTDEETTEKENDENINDKKRKRKYNIDKNNKKRKKNPKPFKLYSPCQRKQGKDVFMMIKMDQWSQVHPECLQNDTELNNIKTIFEFIWEEMHPSEKYAYMQYSTIDEKYQIAVENNIIFYISNSFWGFWQEISTFFKELICTREKFNKLN